MRICFTLNSGDALVSSVPYFYPLKNTITAHPLELAESQTLEKGQAEKQALTTTQLATCHSPW